MNARHTPGPWAVYPSNGGDPIIGPAATDDGRFAIARAYFPNYSPDGIVAARREVDANARLIAAAPELLAACEQAEYWLAHDDGSAEPVEMLRVLRAALAKVQP